MLRSLKLKQVSASRRRYDRIHCLCRLSS